MACVRELNSHQKAIKVYKWLDAGEQLTMAEIARRLGITINGAKYIMAAISAQEAITESDGKLRLVKCDCTRS